MIPCFVAATVFAALLTAFPTLFTLSTPDLTLSKAPIPEVTLLRALPGALVKLLIPEVTLFRALLGAVI